MEALERLVKETSEQMKDTDREMKETARQMKETDRQMKETDRRMGKLTSAWGHFVTHLLAPGAEERLRERGFEVRGSNLECRRRLGGEEMEIDQLMPARAPWGADVVIVLEAKSHLTVPDVRGFENRLGDFSRFFPEYRGWQLLGAVAGVRLSAGAIQQAVKRGRFVLVPSGETARLANDAGFVPRVLGTSDGGDGRGG